MKAKIKATGEIVDVIEWSHSVVHPKVYSITFLHNGNYKRIDDADEFEILPDEPEILTAEFDWDAFRNEGAKDVVCSIISNTCMVINLEGVTIELIAIRAIRVMDELIRQLKATNYEKPA